MNIYKIFSDLKNNNEEIRHRIYRDIRNLLASRRRKKLLHSMRVGNFWSNNSIEYESKDNKKKRNTISHK